MFQKNKPSVPKIVRNLNYKIYFGQKSDFSECKNPFFGIEIEVTTKTKIENGTRMEQNGFSQWSNKERNRVRRIKWVTFLCFIDAHLQGELEKPSSLNYLNVIRMKDFGLEWNTQRIELSEKLFTHRILGSLNSTCETNRHFLQKKNSRWP